MQAKNLLSIWDYLFNAISDCFKYLAYKPWGSVIILLIAISTFIWNRRNPSKYENSEIKGWTATIGFFILALIHLVYHIIHWGEHYW